MNEMIGRGMVLIGLVLAVIALWLDVLPDTKYFDDGTQGAFLLAVAVIAGLLLAVSWLQNRPQPTRIALGLCVLLLGYYVFFPAALAFSNLDEMEAGGWLGLVGAVIAVIGAWIGSRSQGAQTVMPSAMGMRGVQMGTLAALGGVVLCVISIWLDASGPTSYWNFSDDYILGILMLIAGVLCGLALLATWMGRGPTSALWASIFALMLCGMFIVGPVATAFNNFGELEVGAWLGFVGGLVAVCGAQLAHMSTATEVRMAAPAPAA
jgi:hypothetical protein